MANDQCDKCGLYVLQNEGTTIHIEHQGQTFEFTYHNRDASDCLNQYISDLRKMFEMKSVPFTQTSLFEQPPTNQ